MENKLLKDNSIKFNSLVKALKEIESLTRNPREYQPSYYTIHHITQKALEDIANIY